MCWQSRSIYWFDISKNRWIDPKTASAMNIHEQTFSLVAQPTNGAQDRAENEWEPNGLSKSFQHKLNRAQQVNSHGITNSKNPIRGRIWFVWVWSKQCRCTEALFFKYFMCLKGNIPLQWVHIEHGILCIDSHIDSNIYYAHKIVRVHFIRSQSRWSN